MTLLDISGVRKGCISRACISEGESFGGTGASQRNSFGLPSLKPGSNQG